MEKLTILHRIRKKKTNFKYHKSFLNILFPNEKIDILYNLQE